MPRYRLAATCTTLLLLSGQGLQADPVAPRWGADGETSVDRLIRTSRDLIGNRPPFELQEEPEVPPTSVPASEALERATTRLQLNDYEGAIPWLEQAVEQTPDLDTAWEALGWSYYRVGRIRDAERLWHRYRERSPDAPRAHGLLAQLAILGGDWHATERHLRDLLALDPDHYEIRYGYAQNLIRLGRLDQADEILQHLARENPRRTDVRADVERLRTLRQQHEQTLSELRDHVDPAFRPERVGDEIELAIILMQEEDYAAAIPLLEQVLRESPTVEMVWEALGWCYFHVGRADEAEELWQQYRMLRPESPRAFSLLAQLAITRSDWQATDEYLKGSLALEPDNYDIRFWYAQNLFRLGRLQPALALYEHLEQEDPDRFDIKVDLARIYAVVQRHEDALDRWTEIVEVLPENLDFRTEFAQVLQVVGSLEEADQEARAILAEDPTRTAMVNLRADIAEISQEPESIVLALRQLIDDAEDPENRAHLHVRLANRYVRLNARDAERWPLTLAMQQYEAALEYDPGYIPWINQISQLALANRNIVVARHWVEKVLQELNPNNRHAWRTLFELELLERNFPAAEQALHELYDRYQPQDPYRYMNLARLEIQRGRYQSAMDALDTLEESGNRGAVFTLLYHGLTESEWVALPTPRRLEEHLLALRKAGFTFLAPMDIPEYFERTRAPQSRTVRKPWAARQFDSLRYAITGHRREPLLEDHAPDKIAVVTFDDGLRSSFILGTPIAQELGVPFGMYVITCIDELNAPMYAAWEEIRAYHETGAWDIGSHLHHAHTAKPAGPDPKPVVFPLANRIWLPERHRLESVREWTGRLRREFALSRALLEKHLALPPGTPLAVAYPYGEIGQEEASNVAHLLNPIRTVLNEASREFQLGFTLDQQGYSVPEDHRLMIRRYEPDWDENASDVVEQAFANHPVFLARRMRVEIATLTDRPYLAQRQIELLRRDGYPDRLLRELIAFTQNRAPATVASSDLDDADRESTHPWGLQPSNAYLAAGYHENKANEAIEHRYGELRGGLNLNPRTGIEVLYRPGRLKQTVTSNAWTRIQQSETAQTREVRTVTENGSTSQSDTMIVTTTTREVQTNRVERFEYQADTEEIRARLTRRISDRASLNLSLGQKTLTVKSREPDVTDGSELVGSVTVVWQPFQTLQLLTSYDRDLVPSARRRITYDAFSCNAQWKISDDWDIALDTRYWHFQDNNSMVQVMASSFWQLFERQGIWAGIEASTQSADEDSDYYWTPYWDTRYAAVARMHRAYPGYFFQFDLRLGVQREEGRPEVRQAYRNLKAQADFDGNWYPGDPPGTGWDTFVGLGCTYRQRFMNTYDLIGGFTVNFLRDYAEHTFTLGIQYNF